jgi:NAD(P)-dependent dehydrogenase (short-subunit alcohol dehydrogenase family)
MSRLPTLLAVTGLAYLASRALARPPLDLGGKVVLITGGSRGLGLVLARKLAQQGAKLTIVARDFAELQQAEESLAALGAPVLALKCDVADEADVRHAVARTVEHYGRIDVLINNAAIITVGPHDTMTLKDYHDAMNINFFGALHFMLAVRDVMRGGGGGNIVNISSVGGKVPVPHLLPYSASKFALSGLSTGWRTELLGEGVVVTTVHPGLMRTGSPRNSDFKGKHEQEYAWFALADNLPGLAQTPETAADEIIDALRHGRAEIVTGVPARVLAKSYALLPGVVGGLLALSDRMLPGRGGIGTQSRKGAESETAFTRAIGTKEQAETTHNQR